MESVKTIFDSFKEFIWDILIYLLPGIYLIMILSICIKHSNDLPSSLVINDSEEAKIFLIILGYILGHVIAGFGYFKESLKKRKRIKFFLGKPYREKIESEILQRTDFITCKNIIEQKLQANNGTSSLNMTLREIKNIVLGYSPGLDQQVYTFTFRSEFCNHIGNVSLIVLFLVILFECLNIFLEQIAKVIDVGYSIQMDIFKTDYFTIVIYVLLLISYYLLRFPRNRFYDLSQRLPFGVYIAKEVK